MMAELKDLLVDKEELDKGLLADLLLPFVGIDIHSGQMVPKEGWEKLNVDQKILVNALTRKAAMSMPEVDLVREAAAAKEIEAATGIKGGTLRPRLVALKDIGLLRQDKDRNYFAPTPAVLQIGKIIGGGVSENGARTSKRTPPKRRATSRRSR